MSEVEFKIDLAEEQLDKLGNGDSVIVGDSAGRTVEINPLVSKE